jgi:hypothetical protein
MPKALRGMVYTHVHIIVNYKGEGTGAQWINP